MKWFNNLKIRSKLVICFFIVSLFIAVVGGIGIYNMKEITSNSSSLYLENCHSVRGLQQFNSNTLHIRLEILNLIDGRDSNKVNETKNTIENFRKENNEIIKMYKQMLLRYFYRRK